MSLKKPSITVIELNQCIESVFFYGQVSINVFTAKCYYLKAFIYRFF